MKACCFYESPVGMLGIAENGIAITDLFFGNTMPNPMWQLLNTPLLTQAINQLEAYFSGERTAFDLPLGAEGTEFQRSVWEALLRIPYGETRSYGQIAEAIGKPKAGRAVGMANHRNPIAIIIPCHRVIGSDGSLVGYGGGINVKTFLLQLERGVIERDKSILG